MRAHFFLLPHDWVRHPRTVRDLDSRDILPLVENALREDIGDGDATTLSTIPEALQASAVIVARENLVVAGLAVARATFESISPACVCSEAMRDGDRAVRGQSLLRIDGPARALLSGERVALNFLQRLCGIATLTSQYVEAVRGTKARILDTRKTTPGWRRLEKYAVACGGGTNHRFGLDDLIMIKDNHLAALREAKPNPIAEAVTQAKKLYPQLKIEVEADRLDQVEQAVEAGAHIILLDNMPSSEIRQAVHLIDGRCQTEASGGITLDSINEIAKTGVDFISVGALTHSAPASDLAMDFLNL